MLNYVYLIVLFPLLGFLVNGLLGRKYLPKRWAGYIACGTVLLSFLLSVGTFIDLNGDIGKYSGIAGMEVNEGAKRVEVEVWEWFPAMQIWGSEESLRIGMNFQVDPLSTVMILVVSFVGFLIHVYSIGYMWEEEGYYRYFAYLNLFMAMMLTLVLAGNFVMMFVGWEGVGLCSYLLIGFFFEKGWCADAGRKAFIVNRIGDSGFLIGLLMMVVLFGTLDISDVMGKISGGEAGGMVLVTIGIMLFIGAVGKSAQIPLFVWLPDAMAGPTPVSALIHAATMVTAGVYMVARCSVLYVHAPAALMIVAVVGGLTAIFAASIGLMQNDIKKVLAYSTVSQLGYMFLGAGVAAFGAAIFHLMTHAFFKALLFLGSGSVIHGMGGEQDIRKMGGLKRKMPVTYWTFLIATLAIAGIPGFSGFFSKDEILWNTYLNNKILWVIGVCAAGMTAFYMMRLVYMTFYGKARYDEGGHHAHESPRVMTVPLIVLAVFSVVIGYVGIPKVLSFGEDINYFEGYLSPVFGHAQAGTATLHTHNRPGVTASHEGGVHSRTDATVSHEPEVHGTAEGEVHGGGHESHTGVELMLMVLAVLVALTGIYVAWEMYMKRKGIAERLAGRFSGLYRLIANKYWVDELYDAVIVRPYYFLCRRSMDFDTWVVDGTVNFTGVFTDMTGNIVKLFQTGYVRTYALYFFIGVVVIIIYFLF